MIVVTPASLLIKILYSPGVVPSGKLTANALFEPQTITVAPEGAAPAELIVAVVNANFATSTEPVPLPSSLRLTLVSPPVADIVGLLPVELFDTVISLTALATGVILMTSAPAVSIIAVPIFGDVNVLLVKV